MKQRKYPKRHGEPWYPAELNFLRGRVKVGSEVNEIAAFLERSEFAVQCAIAKHCPKLEPEPVSSKGLVINGRDYDKILDVAKHLVSDKAILSAEMYLASIGSPVGFLNKMR